MFKVETLTTDEAIASIVAKMKVLRADEDDSNEGKYEMFAEKLVFEILTYCNREDFPKPLIYTCLDLVNKWYSEAYDDNELKNVKSIKMDDTEFQFNTGTVASSVGISADQDFNTIRSKLNPYRKLRCFD